MVFKHDIVEYDIYERKLWRHYSGDGRELKREPDRCSIPEGDPPPEECEWEDDPTDTMYFIRSSVMGGEVISEANETGQKLKTIVYAGGEAIAWQTFDQYGATVVFEHYDASRMTRRMTKPDGSTVLGTGIETSAAEFDALGQSIGIEDQPVRERRSTNFFAASDNWRSLR